MAEPTAEDKAKAAAGGHFGSSPEEKAAIAIEDAIRKEHGIEPRPTSDKRVAEKPWVSPGAEPK